MRQRPADALGVPAPGARGLRAALPTLTWSDGAALAAVLLWALSYPITKSLLTAVTPITATFVRLLLAALLFATVLAVRREWRLPGRADLPRLLTIAIVGVVANGILFTTGLHLTSASHAGLIYVGIPLLLFAFSYISGVLRPRVLDLAGLALGLGGGTLIVGAPLIFGGDEGGATLVGDLLVVGAMATWALFTYLATPLLRRHGALRTTTWVMILGAIGMLPLSVSDLASQDWGTLSVPYYLAFLYSGLGSGSLGTLLWYRAVGRLGPARTGVYGNLQSLFVVVFAALLLAERVEPVAVLGGLAVIAGVLLTRPPRASARAD